MANWAISIGVNKYGPPLPPLKGAVSDALRMAEWLLDSSGGNVPSRNLFVLLSPARAQGIPARIQPLPATTDMIVEVVRRVKLQSGGQGERLFFYYSGHGLGLQQGIGSDDVLIPEDYSDKFTYKSLSFNTILAYFKATRLLDQFFFIDACRNAPVQRVFVPGGISQDEVPDPSVPVQQFVVCATSQGVKAAELRQAGNERGAFTDTLLAGLRGQGKAKVWDGEAGDYIVKFDALFEFTKNEITTRKKVVVQDDLARDLIQEPKRRGEIGATGRDSNPELARLPAGTFPSEILSVFLEPSTAVPVAEVIITREEFPVANQSHLNSLPIQFSLQPREYTVRAAAPNYVPAERKWPTVRLYSPENVTVALQAQGAGAPALAGGGSGHNGRLAQVVIMTARDVGDRFAPLELANAAGNVVKRGLGYLWCMDVQPGYYTARLRTPEGEVVEQTMELQPGDNGTVELEAPKAPATRLMQEVMSAANFRVRPDNTVEVSESAGIGGIAAPQLSTILTLAGSVGTIDIKQLGASRLRSLGLRAFSEAVPVEAPSGLRVLFGVEAGDANEAQHFLSGVRLRSWHFSEPFPEVPSALAGFSSASGLAEFAMARTVGPHWLSVELPDQPAVRFAVAMLPGRLTMLVFHMDAERRMHIFQYLPALRPRDDQLSEGDSHPRTMRRLNLIQRFYMEGRLDDAFASTRGLLNAKWVEPIAGCIGGYVLLRLSKDAQPAEDLNVASKNMTSSFGELSDSHVLRAKYQAGLGNSEEAAASFRAALDAGLPIFAEGLAHLLHGIQRYGVEHPRARLAEEVFRAGVPGLVWTARTSPDLLSLRPVAPFVDEHKLIRETANETVALAYSVGSGQSTPADHAQTLIDTVQVRLEEKGLQLDDAKKREITQQIRRAIQWRRDKSVMDELERQHFEKLLASLRRS